ncbi:MAG: LysR family transcriptional regulator [Roseobacter sp.]
MTWFRAFDATARHLSFTRAAHELGFTQSAISQNVRALEDKLGTPLFIRGHRTLSLTDAGRLLVLDVAAAMARLEQATERFLPTLTRPKLTIAASVSVAQWIIAPRLPEFIAANPDIALQISTTIWPDDFASTTADIEIRFGSKAVVGKDAEVLAPSHLHAVATPDIAADIAGATDEAIFSDYSLIQPIGISAGWNELAKASSHRAPVEAQIFVDTHGLAVDLALSGSGIALTHTQITNCAINDGRLVPLNLPQIPAEEGYYLAKNASSFPQAQDRFVSWLTASLGA